MTSSDASEPVGGELDDVFSGVDRRPIPSREARDRAYALARGEWRRVVAARKRRRNQIMALAATVVLFVGGIAVVWNATPDRWTVEMAAGEVRVEGVEGQSGARTVDGAAELAIEAGTRLLAGAATRLVTGDGADIRLKAGSNVEWLSADELRLERGSVYLDTHGKSNLAVMTDRGRIRDIGTRFMVTVEPGSVAVRVREGAAAVESKRGRYVAAPQRPAMAAVVEISGERVTSFEEPASNPDWNWIHEVPGGYRSRVAAALLAEVAADLGKNLVFESRGAEAAAATEIISGDLTAVRPRDALRLVARSAGLSWLEDPSHIRVDFRN